MSTIVKRSRRKTERPILHIIKPDGTVESAQWHGKLEYGCPSWERMQKLMGCRHVEHVTVVVGTERRHMFVDEMGGITNPPPPYNWKATAVYANYSMMQEGYSQALYSDLQAQPRFSIKDYAKMGFLIFGTVLLWEGKML